MRGRTTTWRQVSGRDVLSSALQKTARRGELVLGLEILKDWLLLGMDGRAPKGAVASLVTNLINRLLVISVEDCLHPGIYPLVERLRRRMWGDAIRDTHDGVSAILELFALVVVASKGRMPSILKIYNRPPDATGSSFSEAFSELYEPLPEEATFESLLRAGDLRCVRVVPVGSDAAGAWAVLTRVVGCSEGRVVIGALRDLWIAMTARKHKEAFLFLYQAIVLVARRDAIGRERDGWTRMPVVPTEIGVQLRPDRVLEFLRSHLREDRPLEIPDYVYDIHTAKGRAMGRTAVDFAHVGSRVTNADRLVLDPEAVARYDRMYK